MLFVERIYGHLIKFSETVIDYLDCGEKNTILILSKKNNKEIKHKPSPCDTTDLRKEDHNVFGEQKEQEILDTECSCWISIDFHLADMTYSSPISLI